MVLVRTRRPALLALLTAGALLAATLVDTGPAAADTAPVAPVPQTVAADSLPTAQINGVAWDQEIVGNTVFVGGNFTTARPPGAAAGTSEVTRTHLMSYDLTTGALTAWAPTLDAQVRAIDASPDGRRLYVVGAFTTVNGATRNRIVAFDTVTGAVDTAFSASAGGEVFAVTASASTVYFGGNFSSAGGVARPGRAAAASAATGATTPWAPVLANGRAYGMEVSPDGSRVVIAGSFTTLNGSGNPGYGMGAVTATTGSSLPWAANSIVRNAGTDSAVYGLSSDADSVYGSGYIYGTGGNTEATFRVSWDGTLRWIADCRGDNYSAASQGGVVYTAGHSHQCQWIGGFPQNEPWINQRALAYDKQPSGIVRANVQAGRPATTQLAFFPAINAGSFTKQYQGAWTVQTNAQYVLYAGEFTTVNGRGQQGLSRFALPSIAPNKQGPQLSAGAWSLTVASDSGGTVRLSWPANHDRDNEQLTYRVIRDGNTAAPVYTTTASSRFWDQPTVAWVDTGRSPGTAYTYRVSATDAYGNVAWTNTVAQTTAASGTYSAYATAVTNDSPTFYYRLGDSGSSVANHLGPVGNTTLVVGTPNRVDGTAGSGVTRGVAGAIANDPNAASRFAGNANGRIVTSPQVYSDDSMSVETWFRTSSPNGQMVGFGNNGSVTGTSSTTDQSLYLAGGRVTWAVFDSAMRTVQSPSTYADGAWHHAAATLGPDGMKLYVDGALVGSRASTTYARGFFGYWKIGGDSTPSGTLNFAGDLDEVAVYKTTLPAAAVAQHVRLRSGGTPPPNAAPVASFGTSVAGLVASADGRPSTDSDGTVTAWSWNWGDGGTGTGATATHPYATAGSYTVTLTVTDDDGATATAARTVTVAGGGGGPTLLAADAFERTSASGWGAAQVGGTWSTATGTNFTVGGGSAASVHTPSATRRSVLSGVSTLSADVSARISVDKVTTGGGVSAGVVGRQGASGFYQGRIRFNPDSTVGLQLLSSSSTVLANTTLPGLAYTPGTPVSLRVQVTGSNPTTLRAKAWAAGSAEPSAWQLTATDATAALQSAGSVGVEAYLSGSATNAPLTVRYDDFAASAVD